MRGIRLGLGQGLCAAGTGKGWPGSTQEPRQSPSMHPAASVLGVAQAQPRQCQTLAQPQGSVCPPPAHPKARPRCMESAQAGHHWCEGRLGWLLLLCPSSWHCSARTIRAPEQGPLVTLSLRRGAEILYSLVLAHARHAGTDDRYPISDYALLSNARRNLGLFQHHDAITGTAKEAVAVDYGVRCVQRAGVQP